MRYKDTGQGSAERGFTLPELLIALVLGLTLMGAILSAYLTTLKSSGDNNEQAQLNYNLRASLDLILSDLKRAGGVTEALSVASTKYATNPFMRDKNNLKLGGTCSSDVCDCVIYSYDLNNDAMVGVGTSASNLDVANGETDEPNEQLGFRLSDDGRIQLRKGRENSAVSSFSCDAGGGSWESLTEDDVQITEFSVNYIDSDGTIIAAPEEIEVTDSDGNVVGYLQERNLQVTISGTKDEFSLTVTGKVRVRNDRYYTP